MDLQAPKTVDHHEWVERMGARLYYTHFSPKQIIGGYVARFPASYGFTREFEGGYVNDPDDPGGCTNKGITIGTLRAWRGDSSVDCNDVANLTDEEAGLIYASNYWAPVWGNQLAIGVNTQVWDFGVNAGPSRAISKLQSVVGSTADGVMGPNTLGSVDAYIQGSGVDTLLHHYHDVRQAYYESLSTFSKYGTGWTRRNDDCLTLSLQLATQEEPDFPRRPDRPTVDSDIDERVKKLEDWAGSFQKQG